MYAVCAHANRGLSCSCSLLRSSPSRALGRRERIFPCCVEIVRYSRQTRVSRNGCRSCCRAGFSVKQHYRLYAINRFPSLKTLDFSKVKPAERDRSARLARSAAGAALESDVRQEAKTFVPGQALDGEESRSVALTTQFTEQDKDDIRQLLANASSAKELEEIENAVKRGVLPPALKRKRQEEASASQNGTNGRDSTAGDESNSSKRARTDSSG